MPYPYAQRSNYAAGDYYNYAAGGIFGTLGKIAGGVLGVAKRVLPGPLGAAAGVVQGVIQPKRTGTQLIPAPSFTPMTMAPVVPVPRGTPGASPVPGITGVIQRALPGGASGFQAGMSGYHLDKATGTKWVKNRRMNPGNARALRRAIRREQAFVGLAKRVLRGTGYTFKRTGVAKKTRRRATR